MCISAPIAFVTKLHYVSFQVSASDIVNAEKFFGPLAHITTSQLPQTRLITLLGETK